MCIVACLYLINVLAIYYAAFPALAYASFCLYAYRSGMRSFRKPSFWIWFMAITILAAVFWNGLSKGNIWDVEGLLVGLKMNLRAIVILTGFAALSRELRNPIIRTVLYHHGFANLYHSVGLAFSVLPGIIDSLPGVRKMMLAPVDSLGMIVKNASSVYPELQKELANQSRVVIITGEIQQGKTSFLLEVLSQLKTFEVKMSGFTAEGVHDDNKRIGYDLVDVDKGDRIEYIRNTEIAGAYRHGKYYFSERGREFGEAILERAGRGMEQLIIIDEIGPIELKAKGWAGDIERLLAATSTPHLWVVRKSILKRVIRQWSIGEVLLIDISENDPFEAAQYIVEFIR